MVSSMDLILSFSKWLPTVTAPSIEKSTFPIFSNYKWSIISKNCEPLCCTPETYNIVNQLYLNFKKSPSLPCDLPYTKFS